MEDASDLINKTTNTSLKITLAITHIIGMKAVRSGAVERDLRQQQTVEKQEQSAESFTASRSMSRDLGKGTSLTLSFRVSYDEKPGIINTNLRTKLSFKDNQDKVLEVCTKPVP